MSIVHDQAMHFIYQQVLERLLSHMSKEQRASLQLLIQRLLVAAGGPEYIGTFRLLVVHGADCRSARLLAILRAAQLSIALRAPVTFKLRVLVACLPTASSAVLEQHERTFSALFMHDDPRVLLQMVEGADVVPFCRRADAAARQWPLTREALLLFGHLVDARPQALLGSRTHLELADAVRRALAEYPGADALVTAVPAHQRRRFAAWARRSLRLAGATRLGSLHQCVDSLASGLGQLRAAVDSPGVAIAVSDSTRSRALPMRVIVIDDLLAQLLRDGQLDVILGCGLEVIQEGPPLAAFVDPLALAQLPETGACGQAPDASRFSQSEPAGPQALPPRRLAKGYGLEQTQVACMLYRPFCDQGAGLERFLQCCHADMLVALPYLHRALQGKSCPDAVKDWIVNTSGLQLAQLRMVYKGRLGTGVRPLLANLARRDVQLRLLSSPAPFKALS
ncbi:hypothetical protein N8H41_02485 [Pseudomonas vlassakiae]|uniref:hypothetical protein n=1 Tax=Pseudomonas vlassakiae TaxID=485888 RepID=UPI0021C5B07F|nr:hypothetical protein [Pseudomonas vlassakiae]MCU0122843.1 hypothetical protein [Pseudomonas vlassakiae]